MADTLLFEWNGVDASQFEASAMFASASWVPSLNVVPTSDVDCFADNYLELVTTGPASAGGVVWLAKDPLPLTGENRRYRIEWDGFGLGSQYGGFSVLSDPAGGGHAVVNLLGQAGWKSRVDAGVHTTNGSTPPQVWNGEKMAHGNTWVLGRKPAAARPELSIMHQVQLGTAQNSRRLNDSIWTGISAYPASWNSLDCLYWGLALQTSGGNLPSNAIIQLATLKVWSYE